MVGGYTEEHKTVKMVLGICVETGACPNTVVVNLALIPDENTPTTVTS